MASGVTLRAIMRPRDSILITFLAITAFAACAPSALAPAPASAPPTASSPAPTTAVAIDRASPTASPAPTEAAKDAAAPKPEPESPARDLREATLRSSQAWDTVRSLVDEVGPRISGSAGDKAAVAWAIRTLSAAGLTAVHAEKATVHHWERGEERGEITAPFPHRVALAALGGSIGTKGPHGLDAEVIEADGIASLEKLGKERVNGKIVFLNAPMERRRDGAEYGRVVAVRGLGAVAAGKLGAVGLIIRSVGTDESRTPHTGAMRYEDNVPKIPAAALSIPDAEMLHRILARGGSVRFHMSLGATMLPDVESANVVGEIPGSASPDEIVLLGAHLDSWDLGQGALDDGAGCAVIIEAARQIGKLAKKPRRTVRVVLFANEEMGLAGARAYAKAHESELSKHVVALEADSGGARVYQATFLGDASRRPRFLDAVAALRAIGVEAGTAPVHGGADIGFLMAAGVPAIDLRQDGMRYFDVHHTSNDTIEQVHKDELDQVAAAYAAVAYAAADGEGDFGRIAEDKRPHP
jgi:carboxypeptidase Q